MGTLKREASLLNRDARARRWRGDCRHGAAAVRPGVSMNRHVAVALSGGVGAALCGLVSCTAHADDGLTAQQIAFAARLVQVESGGNQRDRTGAVLTSAAGARGLFQLMPGTAAHLGVNPDTASGNVRGGLSEIVRLWDRYHGNEHLVSAAYNCGTQCVDDWLAGRRVLPAETVRYVESVAADANGPGVNAQNGKEAAVASPHPAPPCDDEDWHVSRACPSSDDWASEREPDHDTVAVAAPNDDALAQASELQLTATRGEN